MFWANPAVKDIALGVTANGVYDLVKRFFRKPAAIAVLAEAQAAPQNADNLQALTGQIAKLLKEDPAFLAELAKLAPQEVTQVSQRQRVGNNSVAVQIHGDNNPVNIKK